MEKERQRKERVGEEYAARFDVIADPTVRAAVKDFYESFYEPEKLIRWWAGLYDPDLGGFYYANSARGVDGYLPDMESTYQILWRLRDFVPDLPGFFGPEITGKIVRFYRSRQDPSDGYFYHPQWTKEQSRANVMRYSRDQDWAIFVLGWLGAKPLYPTAIDRAANGEGATTSPEWEPNETSVRNYIDKLLRKTRCEHWANQIETQATTFKATGMLDTVLDVLDERVNPDYGLWVVGYDPETDIYTNPAGTPEIPYGIFTNAYKIAKTYNVGGRSLPNGLRMAEYAVRAIETGDSGARVTYLFNPWATLGNVRDNLSSYGSPAMLAAYDALIRNHIVTMLAASKNNLVRYRWGDGSFSYLQSGSKSTIYDTPVSLGKEEGDVNGNNLVVLFATHICNVLGLPAMIPVFSARHADLMLNLMKNAPKIEKTAR